MRWFDGHLDLTYIADHGRDFTRDAATCGGTLQPATITFPSLRTGAVWAAVSTIFVRRERKSEGITGPFCFETLNEAFAAASRQVEMHRAWERAGLLRFPRAGVIGGNADALLVVLALEGTACLRTLEDLEYFTAAGVRVVALAWAEGSRWAGGDQSGGDVSTDGLALIDRLDELQCVHDVSHLSERAFWTLMARAKGPKVASHSNCRALLPGAQYPERHLSDQQIRALAESGGVIGINLFARFLVPTEELKLRRARIADVVRHMDHMTQVAGRRDFLALGSDMDSGFGADLLPEDLQGPTELPRLADALSKVGWGDTEIARFANRWSELLGIPGPSD